MTPEGEREPVHDVVCAVCATVYQDGDGVQKLRRCPTCGSRLVRRDDGSLTAVTTAEPPPPPPKDPGAVTTGTKVAVPMSATRRAGGAMIITALVMLMLGPGLFSNSLVLPLLGIGASGMFSAIYVLLLILLLCVGGVCMITTGGGTKPPQTFSLTEQPCYACGYPLPRGHRGRCTECGKLQNRFDRRNYTCPGCRRTLRGYHGDHCPECGADVRDVTDGAPPDQPAAD